MKYSFFFMLLLIGIMIAPVPASYGAGEGGGGGGIDVQLDYEDHDEYLDDDGDENISKDGFKEIDFESLDEPIIVKTGIWLNNVGKIDKESGVYELDFWYFMESDDINFLEVGPIPFSFVNVKSFKIENEFMDEHYWEGRVRGIFFNTLDFTDYPFEKIELNVEVEPDMPFHTGNAVFVFHHEISGIDENLNVVGWVLQEPKFEVIIHDYGGIWYPFSQFIATIPIERNVTGALLTTFLPVTLIAGLSLLIFYIPENYTPRIYLTAPLLLGLIFLHQGALGSLPTLSGMTIFDKVMVIIYAIMANSITSLAIQMKIHVSTTLDDKAKHVKIKNVNKIMLLGVPVIIAVLTGLMMFTS